MCPILEPNTTAQMFLLMSHVLRSCVYTCVQNCDSFPRSFLIGSPGTLHGCHNFLDFTVSWICSPPWKMPYPGSPGFSKSTNRPVFLGLGHPDVIMYVVVVLGPIPSGYDPDDGSEEEVKVQARNRNDHTNTLLQPSHARGSQTPHVIARLKQHLPHIGM